MGHQTEYSTGGAWPYLYAFGDPDDPVATDLTEDQIKEHGPEACWWAAVGEVGNHVTIIAGPYKTQGQAVLTCSRVNRAMLEPDEKTETPTMDEIVVRLNELAGDFKDWSKRHDELVGRLAGQEPEYKYALMDGRAAYDLEAATVIVMCDTEDEACKESEEGTHGDDCVVVRFTVGAGNELVDPVVVRSKA